MWGVSSQAEPSALGATFQVSVPQCSHPSTATAWDWPDGLQHCSYDTVIMHDVTWGSGPCVIET